MVPEVALSGGINGDERASAETLLRLAWDLCRRFRHGDAEVVELLQRTSIHILPAINLDGVEKRQRENARGEDLDAKFPVIGLRRQVGFQQVRFGPRGPTTCWPVQPTSKGGREAEVC
jgi:murein tripeptide amidase MpaA